MTYWPDLQLPPINLWNLPWWVGGGEDNERIRTDSASKKADAQSRVGTRISKAILTRETIIRAGGYR